MEGDKSVDDFNDFILKLNEESRVNSVSPATSQLIVYVRCPWPRPQQHRIQQRLPGSSSAKVPIVGDLDSSYRNSKLKSSILRKASYDGVGNEQAPSFELQPGLDVATFTSDSLSLSVSPSETDEQINESGIKHALAIDPSLLDSPSPSPDIAESTFPRK